MAENVSLPVAGWFSDPGPFTAAPDGALAVADNVMVRRPGVVEPRGGIIRREDSGAGESQHVFEFDGSRFNMTTTGVRRDESATVTVPFDASFEPRSVLANRRALATTPEGVFAVDDATVSEARIAGLARPPVPAGIGATTAGDVWLAAGSTTMYRLVLVRQVGTLSIYSPPSRPFTVRAISGTSAPSLTFNPKWFSMASALPGDEIQIYRTAVAAPAPTFPADDMRLRATVRIEPDGGGNLPASIVFVDRTPDNQWTGPTLYTNADQEGILLANLRPPYATDIALYNGMTFYAGAESPERVSITAKHASLDMVGDGIVNPSAVFGVAFFNATSTAGSNVVTPATATHTKYVAVGQRVTAVGGGIPAGTYVTSVGPTSFTISNNATANSVSTHTVQDVVAVDDGATTVEAPIIINLVTDAASLLEQRWVDMNGSTSTTPGALPTVDIRMQVDGFAGVAGGFTLTFERFNHPGTPFVVRTTKPQAFDRIVDWTTGITSEREGGPHRIAWSKLDQPEAVPLPFYVDVVPRGQTIYRIVPSRDTLWLFTSLGTYGLRGFTPDGLSIQPFDVSLILSRRQHVAVGHDAVWLWSTRGIMRLTEGGAQKIDGAIDREVRTEASTLDAFSAPWTACSHDHGFVAFGLRSNSESRALVFNVNTGTWCRWTFDKAITSAADADDGDMLFGLGAGGTARYQYRESVLAGNIGTPAHSYDAREEAWLTLTAQSVASNGRATVTLAGGTGYVPQVGDAFHVLGQPKYIVTVNSPTEVVLDSAFPSAMPLTVRVLEAFTARVHWVARAEGNIGVDKFWTQATFPMERMRDGGALTFEYASFQDSTTAIEDVAYNVHANDPTHTGGTLAAWLAFWLGGSAGRPPRPHVFKQLVPTDTARGWALKCGFSQRQAAAFFSTAGLHLTYRYSTTAGAE
jgi:hypothetical protein